MTEGARCAYKYHQSALERNFLLRSVAGSTARKFLRTRSYRELVLASCVWTNVRRSHTLHSALRPREKLQMRHSNFYEEYSLVAVLLLFSECAAQCLSRFHFLSPLSLAAAGNGRGKEQRTNSRKYENATRYALEFTDDDTHV